jgi:hypothetical protein
MGIRYDIILVIRLEQRIVPLVPLMWQHYLRDKAMKIHQREVINMTVYETLNVMLCFGSFIVTFIALIIVIIKFQPMLWSSFL